jgi:hypothetical protein
MKANSISKINLSPKTIAVSGITGLSSILINKTLLRDVNPMIKFGGGILMGGILAHFSKNKIVKQAGIGLVISNSANWIYDAIQKNDCPFEFGNHLSTSNALLINTNSGKVIGENLVEEGFIFLTDKNDHKGWSHSFKLKHCLNISGVSGGLPSKKGDSVQWWKLQNHTKEFNNLLLHWISFFENKKNEYDDSLTDTANKVLYWRSMVNDGKHLDIKKSSWSPAIKGEWSKYNDTLLRYDDYGNILYGAAGTAFGLDETTLLSGANLNQLKKTGFDDEKDSYSIKRGIAIYKNNFKQVKKIA